MRTENKINVLVSLRYCDLYPEEKENAEDLLKNISLDHVLQFILERQAKVQYTPDDTTAHTDLLKEMKSNLSQDAQQRLEEKKKSNSLCVFSNMSTLRFIMLALQTCDWKTNNTLETNIENIYKAYLICNGQWTNLQNKEIGQLMEQNNIPASLIIADVPIVEFKTYKECIPQIYKAIKLFSFMSNTSPYNTYLSLFLKEKNANNWNDYITMLLDLYSETFNDSIVNIKNSTTSQSFFDSICVNKSECYKLWEEKNMTYLREHPLLKTQKDTYMVLNPNFLIDKIYQGVKFDIFRAMVKGKANDSKGRKFTEERFGDFSSMLGKDFSETEMFYSIMSKAFNNKVDKIITGAEMECANILAPSDYYIRINNTVFLFEYKDVTISDKVKNSCKYEEIKKAILDRISKDENNDRKGVGQLLFSIEQINTEYKNQLKNLDPDFNNVKTFYPIVITTDRTFTSLGINDIVVTSFTELKKRRTSLDNITIQNPIVLDLDTLFLMSRRIQDGNIDFTEIVKNYLSSNNRFSSFYTFYREIYKDHLTLNKEDTSFLFGDIINNCIDITMQ